MIHRLLLSDLRSWAENPHRKPLIIRGARQVGKTTLVDTFSTEFDGYVKLNLERADDRRIFDLDSPGKILDLLHLTRLQHIPDLRSRRILLFIDEIQSEPKAIGMLRYFYEEMPWLYIIAAGSRLQELFKSGVSFPVGRVEYLTMRPCFFEEFLQGTGNSALASMVAAAEVPSHFHADMMEKFRTFALVGGMPEVVTRYAEIGNVASLASLYRGLLQSYDEDVEKYAVSRQQVNILRHLLRSGWSYAGQTITFSHFAGSDYASTPVHEAFELIEKAFLADLCYPSSSVKAPIQPNLRRAPKLIWLDSGLVNFSASIQAEYLTDTTFSDLWRGHAAEQCVGQELRLPSDRNYIDSLNFWQRDKRGSEAEIDFLLPVDNRLIPLEVKSGSNSHLRSLQQYMLTPGAPDIAIRVWPEPYSIDELQTPDGRPFRLVNLPFYLVGQADKIIRREG